MKPILFFLPLLVVGVLQAQQQDTVTYTKDFYDMNLKELMSTKIAVTKTNLNAQESPSIISVVTSEEIANMGARDLMDVLNMVAGFNFGLDVGGVVGISARGNWAHEGKVLLLLDGQEMNEILFSNTAFGMHYDCTQIDRIEIIRGPGSSLYGGFAELGVINIITKGASLKGAQVSTMYGQLSNSFGRMAASVALGNKTKRLNYSLSGYIAKAQRSISDYTDIEGATINLKGNTDIKASMINVGLESGKWSGRIIYDKYSNETPMYYDTLLNENMEVHFDGLYSEIKYRGNMGKISVTPKLNYKIGVPWSSNYHVILPGLDDYKIITSRFSPSIHMAKNFSPQINLIWGGDFNLDYAYRKLGAENPVFYNNKKDLGFFNVGAYFQFSYKAKLPFFIGARIDEHSHYGFAFSPRIGIAKKFESWHFKTLFSKAFRPPVIENLNLNPDLKPEHTWVGEIELGYKLSRNSYLTINTFHIQINKPIIYFSDIAQSYINYKSTGTQGFEVEYRYKSNKGYAVMNYSFYSPRNFLTRANMNKVIAYQIPSEDKLLLAWPGSKLNIYSSFQITQRFSINPSLSYLSQRYAVSQYDANNQYVYTSIPQRVYFNLFLGYKNLFIQKLDLGLGVNDLTNQGQVFIQPYNSSNSGNATSPISGIGREFILRLGYIIAY